MKTSIAVTRQKTAIFVIVLALLLIGGILVAQKTTQQVVAPAESGQGQQEDTTTETLMYRKNGQTVQYDPATGTETPTVRGGGDMYPGNLGTSVMTRHEEKTVPGKEGIFVFETYVITSPNGNTIVSEYYDPITTIVRVPGLPDYTLPVETFTTIYGTTARMEILPIGWVDRTHLLVAKGQPDVPVQGVSIIDIATGEERVILKAETYIEAPYLSPSGRYLAYKQVVGKYDTQEYEATEAFIYDLQTGTVKKIITDSGGFIGWTIKKVAKNPAPAGFFVPSGICGDTIHCGYPSPLTFKLPFKCGEVYRVSRDGQSHTPAQCGLGNGGYPLSTWTSPSGPHTCKRAIDFADQSVGGTGSDNLPVLAAAGGLVVQAGWQNPNNHSAGFGLRVWIKHTDGTFTVCGHLSAVSVSQGATVVQGQQIGLEGSTGFSTGEHIHFERRTGIPPAYNLPSGERGNSYWMQFNELGAGQLPQDNYIYISKNGSCPMNCNGVGVLPNCGGTFSGQSNIGLLNTRATYFVNMPGVPGNNAASVNESGPDKVYKITTTVMGPLTVTLSNVSYTFGNDFDVFILAVPGNNCSNLDPLLHCKGSSSGLSATYTGAPAGTYYIIVDGVNGSTGYYTMTVAAPCVNLPNLTDYSSTKTASGRNVTINARVVNNGAGNAGAFITRFYLSSDPAFGNDYYFGGLSYNGLQAGYYNSYTYTWTISASVPSGNYYVLEWIDYANTVAESNENDNGWYLGSTIFLPPAFGDGHVDGRAGVVGMVKIVADTTNESIELTLAEGGDDIPVQISMPYNLEQNTKAQVCTAKVSGYDISATVEPGSRYLLTKPLGRVICQGKDNDGAINCSTQTTGIYFLTIVSSTGERCTQKVFVRN